MIDLTFKQSIGAAMMAVFWVVAIITIAYSIGWLNTLYILGYFCGAILWIGLALWFLNKEDKVQ